MASVYSSTMKQRIIIGAAVLVALVIGWNGCENGKQIGALQAQMSKCESNMSTLGQSHNQMGGALIELIRRTGHTNMLRGP